MKKSSSNSSLFVSSSRSNASSQPLEITSQQHRRQYIKRRSMDYMDDSSGNGTGNSNNNHHHESENNNINNVSRSLSSSSSSASMKRRKNYTHPFHHIHQHHHQQQEEQHQHYHHYQFLQSMIRIMHEWWWMKNNKKGNANDQEYHHNSNNNNNNNHKHNNNNNSNRQDHHDTDDQAQYNNNNNKYNNDKRQRPQSNRTSDWYNIMVSLIAILLFLGIIHSLYQYYLHTFIYRPHYNSQTDAQSRSYRFPTVSQRIQLYMSNWHNTLPYDDDCVDIMKTVSNHHDDDVVINVTHPTNRIEYSTEYNHHQYRNGIKYYTIQNHSHSDRNNSTAVNVAVVTNQVQIGTIFYTDFVQLHLCYQNTSYSIRYYCRDMMESLLVMAPYDIPLSIIRFLCTYDILFYHILIPYIDRIQRNTYTKNNIPLPPPIMVQFSDETESWIYTTTTTSSSSSSSYNVSHMEKLHHPHIPHLKKIRYALHRTDIDRIMTRTIHNDYSDRDEITSSSAACQSSLSKSSLHQHSPPVVWKGMTELQPILWLLNENRHFKYTWDINRYDQSYSTKKNMTVFRGMLTGPDIDPSVDDYTNCMSLPRCRLVYQTYNSNYVDAKITDTLNKLPDTILNRNITGPHLFKEDILSYKGILILEGNDVSSGLKWAMLSNSVVLMSPKIKYSSWMMEELLEPYVHYIPIDLEEDNDNDMSVETQTLWMLQHEAEVQRIIHRAKLWILDLYYHPMARTDRIAINAGILQQYQQYFIPSIETTTTTRTT